MRCIASTDFGDLRATLQGDGVARIDGLLNQDELQHLADILENCIHDSNQMLLDYGSSRRVVNGFFLWRRSEDLSQFICNTYLPFLAAEMLHSSKINLFCDNIFFKEPKTPSHTSPWHNDQANWIVDGVQVATIWIALDDITRASGAMQFAKGSHRWQYLADGRCSKDGVVFESIAAVGEDLGEDEIICHELAAGDATIHLGNTLHAADGNHTDHMRRRGYAIRYAGDDVVYKPNASFETPTAIELAPGAPLDSPLFPVVFQR